jgi:aryl-alcohol dehydrogenase-like predicted oxidoreductase
MSGGDMRYRLLGGTGLRVSEVALGTMTFGQTSWGAEKQEARQIFERYASAGGNFIDTADLYGLGESERWVAELIRSDRNRFVVSTKYGLTRGTDDPNGSGAHRRSLVAAVNASLDRLKVDHIDVYWVHAWDPYTPMSEVMRALDDLVRAGKILYLGISDTPAWVVARANAIADLRGWTPFAAYQGRYSLIDRDVEREVLPMARGLDLSFVAWGVLANGLLSGKYARGAGSGGRLDIVGQAGKEDRRSAEIVQAVGDIAAQLSVTPSQVAVRWVLEQAGVIPLIGARTLAQYDDNIAALKLTLAEEHRARLSEAAAIDLGFPHSFVEQGREQLFGPAWARVAAPSPLRS